jgi:lipoprotein signal peptidase
MVERSFRGLLYTLAVIGLIADLTTKYIAFRTLAPHGGAGEHNLVPGVFKFIAQFTDEPLEADTWRGPLQALNGPTMPRVNHGALFGIGGGMQFTANGVFAAISLFAACAILIWSRRPATARDGVLCAALGLILGGTLGNLFDRVIFHGVRDFLYFYWIEWPVFNVADCCLVVGAGLLLIQAAWPGQPATETTPELASSSAGPPRS